MGKNEREKKESQQKMQLRKKRQENTNSYCPAAMRIVLFNLRREGRNTERNEGGRDRARENREEEWELGQTGRAVGGAEDLRFLIVIETVSFSITVIRVIF